VEPGAASIAIEEKIHYRGDLYVLFEIAPGNRLLTFSSKDKELRS